jgi:hypothetical protein
MYILKHNRKLNVFFLKQADEISENPQGCALYRGTGITDMDVRILPKIGTPDA